MCSTKRMQSKCSIKHQSDLKIVMCGATRTAECCGGKIVRQIRLVRAGVAGISMSRHSARSGLVRGSPRFASTDNGPGIPDHEGLVPQTFLSCRSVRHWQQEGSGIGLAIGRPRSEAHRGMIGLRNKTERRPDCRDFSAGRRAVSKLKLRCNRCSYFAVVNGRSGKVWMSGREFVTYRNF